jgi:hypothetical protein
MFIQLQMVVIFTLCIRCFVHLIYSVHLISKYFLPDYQGAKTCVYSLKLGWMFYSVVCLSFQMTICSSFGFLRRILSDKVCFIVCWFQARQQWRSRHDWRWNGVDHSSNPQLSTSLAWYLTPALIWLFLNA